MSGKLPILLKVSLITLLAASLVAFITMAASDGFSVPWWTVDSGGGTSKGGDFAVSGTFGQPDAGPLMSGGDYAITGGFWVGDLTHPSSFPVYFPLLVR